MDKRQFFRWWFLVAAAAVLGLACNLTGGSETPVAVEEATVEVATVTVESQAATDVPVIEEPTATSAAVAATATLATEGEQTQPTPTSETAEIEPTTAVTVTIEATLTPTVAPVLAPLGTIAPGQQTNGSLAGGDTQFYSFEGIKFEPVIAFVEGDDDLDIALSAYQGTVGAGTDLGQLQPVSQGDFGGPGQPEILVITPEEDVPITVAVQGNGTTGNFTLYMYDGTTPAANTRLVNDSVEPGQTRNYKALSNGGRPVIIFIDPIDQSDVVLQVQYESGELITEANFGGPGSAETAFVLPRADTAYTIFVSTVSDETAVYNLVIVTLN
jgi:hypothetical protein